MTKIEIFQAKNGANHTAFSRHIKNIYKSEELEEKATVAIFATAASDGKTYQVEYYN